MNSLWKIARNVMAVIGCFLAFCAVSTADYYVIELGQHEPEHVPAMLIIGLLMMIPAIIRLMQK